MTRTEPSAGGPGDARTVRLHGHEVRYRTLGDGPPLVLLHGITSSSRAWSDVLPALAERHTVVAPDLLGHGESAKPVGDYSLGAYASGVRDLLIALGIERATVVGHSLGGGIAMQLAYQFPERVERLALVASGGLGRSVHPLLRAATLPGTEAVLALVLRPPVVDAGASAGRLLGRLGLRPSPDVRGVAEGLGSLADGGALRAFVHTARSIMDAGGQRVDARDRLYLAAAMPTLIVWGEDDPMIPAAHGRRAHELMPHSRLEIFPGAGHFPFRDDPARFAAVLRDFVASTPAAPADDGRLRELLLREAA